MERFSDFFPRDLDPPTHFHSYLVFWKLFYFAKPLSTVSMILGDNVVQLADHLCNSVGILQQFAPSGSFAGFEKTASKQPAVTNEGKFNLNMYEFNCLRSHHQR